jgi:hypothetical protein
MNIVDVTLNRDGFELDLKIISAYITEISQVMSEAATEINAAKLRISKNSRIKKGAARLAYLLDQSVKVKYRSESGILYGATVDRVALTCQCALKAVLQSKPVEFQRSFEEMNRTFALLQSLMNIEPVSSTSTPH